MTSHCDSHTTTDVKLEMIPGILTGNAIQHDKYDIPGIAHARTNKKDKIFMQRWLYIDEAHTAPDIFSFAIFFFWKFLMTSLGKMLVLSFLENLYRSVDAESAQEHLVVSNYYTIYKEYQVILLVITRQ